jgi:hypothetical protein
VAERFGISAPNTVGYGIALAAHPKAGTEERFILLNRDDDGRTRQLKE